MPQFSFIGTRGGPKTAMFSAAILAPDASYGGIYVPEQIPMLKPLYYLFFYTSLTKAS